MSSDFNHDPHSSTFDLTQTVVLGKRFCRVLVVVRQRVGLLEPHGRGGRARRQDGVSAAHHRPFAGPRRAPRSPRQRRSGLPRDLGERARRRRPMPARAGSRRWSPRPRAAHPGVAVEAVLDCGDEAGTVLAALRAGFKRVRFTGPSRRARETRARSPPRSAPRSRAGDRRRARSPRRARPRGRVPRLSRRARERR